MSRRKLFLPLLFLCIILISILNSPLYAQEWRGSGRISGRITTSEGTPIIGCKVVLKHERYGSGPTVETDEDGRWAVAGIAGGLWLIDFIHPDYQPYGISITVSQIRRGKPVEITLEPAVRTVAGVEAEIVGEVQAAEDLFNEGKFDEALESFRSLAVKVPDVSGFKVRIAECLFELGKYDEAAEEADKILEAEPNNTGALTVKGNSAFNSGDYAEAERCYLKLIELAPNDGGVWANLAEISTNNQKYDQAQNAYAKAIELNPGFFNLYVQLAATQMVANNYEQAIETLELLKERAPADHPIFSVWNVDELIASCRQELEEQQ